MAQDRNRRRSGPAGRNRGDDARGAQDRLRLAQAAARLIAEHGYDDWGLAKRKAARQLLMPESTPYPSNDEVEAALTEFQSLFGGDAQVRSLRAQRLRALEWMQRLAPWAPLLVGGVAAGWASPHSDVCIELAADDPKAVEMTLAGRAVGYQVPPRHPQQRNTELLIAEPAASIRLSIVALNDRRNRPRNDTEARLDTDAVRALLADR